jgi:hypothetical protein
MNNRKTILRWIGNLFLVIGYFILLYSNVKIGLSLKFLGGILMIPSFVQLKMWDALMIGGIFAFIEGSKLIQLYSVK